MGRILFFSRNEEDNILFVRYYRYVYDFDVNGIEPACSPLDWIRSTMNMS
jgi:hypothetical protein